MKQALLIGFTYHGKKNPLPGSLIDLYRFYNFLLKQGFDRIDVIADLKTNPKIDDYRSAILDGCINANILSFVSELQDKQRYHFITHSKQLQDTINIHLNQVTFGVIYFTGHGTKQGYCCPENLLSWKDLQRTIFTLCTRRSHLFMLLDTCHGYNFQLPYVLARKENYFIFDNSSFFPAGYFILLTTESKEAAATNFGSLITRSFLNLLEKGYDEYYSLRNMIEEDLMQTPTLRLMQLKVGVYASYPNLYHIWDWFWLQPKPIQIHQDGIFIHLLKV